MKRQSAVHVVHVECTLKHQRALGYDQVTQRQSEVSARCARCSPPFLRKRTKRDRERGAGAGAGVCKRIKTFFQFFFENVVSTCTTCTRPLCGVISYSHNRVHVEKKQRAQHALTATNVHSGSYRAR